MESQKIRTWLIYGLLGFVAGFAALVLWFVIGPLPSVPAEYNKFLFLFAFLARRFVEMPSLMALSFIGGAVLGSWKKHWGWALAGGFFASLLVSCLLAFWFGFTLPDRF